MIGKAILDRTNRTTLLKSLDAATLRNRVIANNIANTNTPGYQRVEVRFEEELRHALERTRLKGSRTDGRHLAIGRKDISRVDAQAYRPIDHTLPSGVNNVDIDNEMAKLAENQILYNFSIKALQGTYRKMNAAIQAKPLPVQ